MKLSTVNAKTPLGVGHKTAEIYRYELSQNRTGCCCHKKSSVDKLQTTVCFTII